MMREVTKELKPCPFCGGEAVIKELFGTFYIDAEHNKNCIIEPNTWLVANSFSMKKQILAWNRRADNAE